MFSFCLCGWSVCACRHGTNKWWTDSWKQKPILAKHGQCQTLHWTLGALGICSNHELTACAVCAVRKSVLGFGSVSTCWSWPLRASCPWFLINMFDNLPCHVLSATLIQAIWRILLESNADVHDKHVNQDSIYQYGTHIHPQEKLMHRTRNW